MYNNSVAYIERLKHVDYKAYKQIEPILKLKQIKVLGGLYKEKVYAYYKDNVQCGKTMFKEITNMLKDTEFEKILNKHGCYIGTYILNTKVLMNVILIKLREYEKTKLDIKDYTVNGYICNSFIVPVTDILNMMSNEDFDLSHKKAIFSDSPKCIAGINSIVSGDYIFIDVDVANSNSYGDTYKIYTRHKDIFLRTVDEYIRYAPLKDTAPKNFYKYGNVKLLTYRTMRFIYELKTEYKGM